MKRPIAYVAGTGRGIPAKVMTNYDFAALGLETSHEWIVERTGIVERRIAAADETTCSMAKTAACQAIDVLVFGFFRRRTVSGRGMSWTPKRHSDRHFHAARQARGLSAMSSRP